MGFIVKLVKGTKELDINSGRYKCGTDFRPPNHDDARRGWNFSINIGANDSVSTDAETHTAISDLQYFLNMAGDKAEPLYLYYKADDTIPFEPVIGTIGRFHRYKIMRGVVTISNTYGQAKTQKMRVIGCQVRMTIEPEASGQKLLTAEASGGIYQDFIGTERLHSRGLHINEASTNLITDPTFSAAWTDIDGDQNGNTNYEYILFGNRSSECIANSGTAIMHVISGNINMSNGVLYTVQFYVKRPGSQAVTSAVCSLIQVATGGAQTAITANYEYVGNGWYLVWGTHTQTGDDATASVGINVNNGYTVYLGAAQCEAKAYLTPFFFGDMPDCAWSGTRNASTSTRVAADLYFDGIPEGNSEFTTVIAWRAGRAETAYSGDFYLHMSSYNLFYDKSETKWTFGRTGSDVVTSAAGQTWARNDLLIFHGTGTPGAFTLYKNGSSIATGAGYRASGSATLNLYIGTDNVAGSATTWAEGTFVYVGVYPRALTAAQVTASYNEVYSAIYNSDNGLIQSPGLPYIWTNGTDETIDQAQDATRDGYALLSGIPGDLPAEVEWRVTTTRASTTAHNLFLGITPVEYNDWAPVDTLKLYDDKGAASADASCSGGYYEGVSVNSTTAWTTNNTATAFLMPQLMSGPIHILARLFATTANTVQVRGKLGLSSIPQVPTTAREISLNSTAKLFYVGSLTMQQFEFLEDYNKKASGRIEFLKLNSTTTTAKVDFINYVVGNLQYQPGAASTAATAKAHIIKGTDAAIAATSTTTPIDIYTMRGTPARPYPERYNIVWAWLAEDGGAHVITETVLFNTVYITPKYAIV